MNMSASSRKPLCYLDRVLKEWTSDPGDRNRDMLVTGSTIDSLNHIFEVNTDGLPGKSSLGIQEASHA